MNALIHEIVKDPLSSLVIVANLFLIESLLSVDNAAVMATVLLKIPKKDRRRALNYGLIGAYLFRGLCLLLATFLVRIWWLKGIGGLYLVYLFISWLFSKKKSDETETAQKSSKLDVWLNDRIGKFWATVITVELMDLAFSLDNVFAAVAYSNNIFIVLTGVFIGILAMRFVAQGFVKLMERYPFLEGCAYCVIAVLGVKLSLSFYQHFYPASAISAILQSRVTDWITSALTISIFFLPLFSSMLFDFPRRQR